MNKNYFQTDMNEIKLVNNDTKMSVCTFAKICAHRHDLHVSWGAFHLAKISGLKFWELSGSHGKEFSIQTG